MTPRKSSKTDPQIREMPPQKMAVVYGKGAPDKVFSEVMPAFYLAILSRQRREERYPVYPRDEVCSSDPAGRY